MRSVVITRRRELLTAALIENGRALSIIEEGKDTADKFRTGNIFRGRIKKIMPGLKAAFVELGGRDGFLPLVDGEPVPNVGQSLCLQITHAAIGKKSARLTQKPTLPMRTVLLLTDATRGVNVSRKIASAEAEKLKELGQRICPAGFGLIMRTAAIRADEEEIAADIAEGQRIYREINEKFARAKRPTLIYDGGSLAKRIMRDGFTEAVDEIVTDDAKIFAELNEAAQIFAPAIVEKIFLYEANEPLFSRYSLAAVETERQSRTLTLPTGGFIVIDKTEALTAIDVNSGSFAATNLDETIWQTNLAAAAEIMRQLRLRNIGGIVIIDFIDMHEEKDRERLLDELRRLAIEDRGRTIVVDMTKLGLVEITRQKSGAL